MGHAIVRGEMARHATFRFRLDPTVEQQAVFGASCRRVAVGVEPLLANGENRPHPTPHRSPLGSALDGLRSDHSFNGWKKTEDAGRVFVVDAHGVAELRVTGLAWRSQVCQQLFEEAAIDCGRAISAWSNSRSGKRRGRRVGFPRFAKKSNTVQSFRLRDKRPKHSRPTIRVGDNGRARSVTLPGIGVVAIHDDTRRLRALLAKGRAEILYATVSYRAGRWWVALNVKAADLHPSHRHPTRADADRSGWVGVDCGLSTFAVAATADGREVARIRDGHKPLDRDVPPTTTREIVGPQDER